MMKIKTFALAGLVCMVLTLASQAAQSDPTVLSKTVSCRGCASVALPDADDMAPVFAEPAPKYDPTPNKQSPQPVPPRTGVGREILVGAGSTLGGTAGGIVTGGNPIGVAIGAGLGGALAHLIARLCGW